MPSHPPMDADKHEESTLAQFSAYSSLAHSHQSPQMGASGPPGTGGVDGAGDATQHRQQVSAVGRNLPHRPDPIQSSHHHHSSSSSSSSSSVHTTSSPTITSMSPMVAHDLYSHADSKADSSSNGDFTNNSDHHGLTSNTRNSLSSFGNSLSSFGTTVLHGFGVGVPDTRDEGSVSDAPQASSGMRDVDVSHDSANTRGSRTMLNGLQNFGTKVLGGFRGHSGGTNSVTNGNNGTGIGDHYDVNSHALRRFPRVDSAQIGGTGRTGTYDYEISYAQPGSQIIEGYQLGALIGQGVCMFCADVVPAACVYYFSRGDCTSLMCCAVW